MAILVLIFAYYCVKNTTQDLIYAITGRVPPSYVREQQRMQFAREAFAARNARPMTAARGRKKFFANAYNDAWETAEERRARWAANRAKKRHGKWDDKDGDVPAPVTTNARPEETPAPSAPGPVVHDNDTYVLGGGGKEESLYQRYAMRRRNGGQSMTAVAIADELDVPVAEVEALQTKWAARYDRDAAGDSDQPPKHLLEYQKHSRCRDCGGELTLDKDPDRPGEWIVGVAHKREDCPQDAKRLTPREQHDQQVQQLANATTQNAREDNRPDGSTSLTEENELTVNAETTGLQSALAYTSAMAEKAGEGATSVETSIASLEQGEVGSGVTSHLTQAQEHLAAAQAAFNSANAELAQHVNVQEAYSATPDAGNKQFVTAE